MPLSVVAEAGRISLHFIPKLGRIRIEPSKYKSGGMQSRNIMNPATPIAALEELIEDIDHPGHVSQSRFWWTEIYKNSIEKFAVFAINLFCRTGMN